jgi:dipeptide transport system ATP-binding protein
MTALVTATDLKRSYEVKQGWFRASAHLQAVGGISFALEAGKTLAVVGESGCGKSTLARLVTLIEKPSAGTLMLDGVDAVNPPASAAKTLRRAILEEPLIINTTLSKQERRAQALDMMAKVGLRPEQYGRYPHMFSGGQRQRIAIARALMLRPKLLVADEPVSALDMSVQAQVLNLLVDLQRELGLAYLFISHDLGVVRHIADDVMIMYLGIAVEHGPKQRIFARPLHPYAQALLDATPGLGRKRQRIVPKGELPSPLDPPKGCVFSIRCPYVTDLCRAQRPPLRPLDGRLVACHYAERFLETQAA